ncbi:MAG TPA: hypothetical protein VFC47_02920 [Caulobacteraceae bacterium]|nr:hypothetical protein [Caulobacteraceae bacterium]
MNFLPVAGLAAVIAVGIGGAAAAQTAYGDPDYAQSVQQYQYQRDAYDNQRQGYDDRAATYDAQRDAYRHQRRDYERARAAYDAEYGSGAYDRYYGYRGYDGDRAPRRDPDRDTW